MKRNREQLTKTVQKKTNLVPAKVHIVTTCQFTKRMVRAHNLSVKTMAHDVSKESQGKSTMYALCTNPRGIIATTTRYTREFLKYLKIGPDPSFT